MFSTAPLWHTLFEFLAFFIGFQFYQRLRKTQQDAISTDHRWVLIASAIIGALVGSRLLGALENPGLFFTGGGSVGWWYYYQSKTILGGLLGGTWAVEITKRVLGLRARSGDLFVFPILLGMWIGRIGCFLMGTLEPTYGTVTEGWWGMDLGDGQLRHPTALYEMIWLSLTFGGLWVLRNRGRYPSGGLYFLFMVGYLMYRFGVGFIQPYPEVWYGLSTLQIAAVVGLIYYLLFDGLLLRWLWQKTS